ncbi:hypothetical protein [Paucibacter soli]|uniref:hypothetical protein n=1 Tax=Paucibacter soli TaxID=3133433 RepID=UPI003094EE13
MFWKVIKWAGTAALIVIVALAAVFGGDSKPSNPDSSTTDSTELQQPAKKFNF